MPNLEVDYSCKEFVPHAFLLRNNDRILASTESTICANPNIKHNYNNSIRYHCIVRYWNSSRSRSRQREQILLHCVLDGARYFSFINLECEAVYQRAYFTRLWSLSLIQPKDYVFAKLSLKNYKDVSWSSTGFHRWTILYIWTSGRCLCINATPKHQLTFVLLDHSKIMASILVCSISLSLCTSYRFTNLFTLSKAINEGTLPQIANKINSRHFKSLFQILHSAPSPVFHSPFLEPSTTTIT